MASIDVVENEEASASVVVKMTDSFTEQADQVTQKRPHHDWGRGTGPRRGGRGTLGRCGLQFYKYLVSDSGSRMYPVREMGKTNKKTQ